MFDLTKKLIKNNYYLWENILFNKRPMWTFPERQPLSTYKNEQQSCLMAYITLNKLRHCDEMF